MDNRFLKSLTTKLEDVNFKETFYEFSEIIIPIPNMLVDDNDPLSRYCRGHNSKRRKLRNS